MSGFLIVFVGLAFGQQAPVEFEGAEIEGELNQANLATLGQRNPWIIPVPLAPPLTMNHHLRLPPSWPVTTPEVDVSAPKTVRKKGKKDGRR
jgi:hypothetical protein